MFHCIGAVHSAIPNATQSQSDEQLGRMNADITKGRKEKENSAEHLFIWLETC